MQYRNKHLENFEPEEPKRVLSGSRHRRSRPSSTKTASRPAPRSPRAVQGPRGPREDRVSALRQSQPTGTPEAVPKITVQKATPTGLGLSMNTPTAPPSPSPTPSPTPSARPSPLASPALPGIHGAPITVPQVDDAALQKFFHDIAEQLQLIGSASPRSSLAIEFPNPPPTPIANPNRRSHLGDITTTQNQYVSPVAGNKPSEFKRKSKRKSCVYRHVLINSCTAGPVSPSHG